MSHNTALQTAIRRIKLLLGLFEKRWYDVLPLETNYKLRYHLSKVGFLMQLVYRSLHTNVGFGIKICAPCLFFFLEIWY